MIVKPNKNDENILYNLWKTIFSYRDGGFINYFFNERYNPKDFYLKKDQDLEEIISGIYLKDEVLNLNSQKFKVKVIDHIFTVHNQRSLGNMTSLLSTVLSEREFKELFTLVKFSPNFDFKKFNFETLYYKKRYTVNRSDLYNVDGYSISNIFKVGELAAVYKNFTTRFNGSFIRNLEDFEHFVEENIASGREIFVTRDLNKQIKGYMLYEYIKSELVILEIIYLDSTALLTLLNQAMGMNAYIYVDVSPYENFSKLIENLDYKLRDYMMIRINDKNLFMAMYKMKTPTIKQVTKSVNKPLYIGYY